MTKIFCGIAALVLMACVVAKASEPVGFELRKSDAIGRLAPVRTPLSLTPQLDGTVLLSFQAPKSGTYLFIYTSGPDKGKVAKRVKVEKAGPVTTKVKARPQ